jgi:hypothetical protein
MSQADTQFLVHYIHWRDAHPVGSGRPYREVTIQ